MLNWKINQTICLYDIFYYKMCIFVDFNGVPLALIYVLFSYGTTIVII